MTDNPSEPVSATEDALARRLLAQARSSPTRTPTSPRRSSPPPVLSSGARPDDRDPQTLGAVVHRWLRDSGWAQKAEAASVIQGWSQIVGPEVADHVRAEITDDGDLLLRADSTAWATQMTLLLPQIRRRIAETIGSGAIGQIRVVGPTPPRRASGPRRVRGPGPRDTYG